MITKETIYALSLIFLPGLIIYSLLKKWSLKKILKFVLIYLYIVAIAAITLFPIPIDKSAGIPSNSNFIPFYGIYELIKYSKTFKIVLLTPMIGNVILFVPFGFFLRIKKPFLKFNNLLIYGLLASFSIELSQLIISFSIQFLYRSIDIDDLIYNTAGTIAGFFICDYLLKIIQKNKDVPIIF